VQQNCVGERPSPENPMHNAKAAWKVCGGGGYLSTGKRPDKKAEAVLVEYRLRRF
jgi:hypothetical protein